MSVKQATASEKNCFSGNLSKVGLAVTKIKLLVILLFSASALLISNVTRAQSNHTVTFTGNAADFNVAEKFSAAANNTDYYITFDATYLYIGAFRISPSVFGTNDNLSIYLDTDPRNTLNSGNGSTAGKAYNGVTPTLAFNADYVCATEETYTDPLYRFNAGWVNTSITPTVFTTTTAREVRIALKDIGNPASVYASLYMGYAGGMYSAAPGLDVAPSATPAITGFFGSFPIYKAGITPISFRAQNTTTANGGGTAISNISVVAGSAITAGDYGDITISNVAGTSTLAGNTSYTGTLTIGAGTTNASRLGLSTFTLTVGGRGIGGTAGQLSVNGSSGAPITTGAGGTFAFLGAGLVSGASTAASMVVFPSSSTVTISGAVDFGNVGTGTPSGMAGTLQINAGGSVNTNPPTYNAGSSLIYNTGTTYTAGAEWTANSTSAKGVPQAVIIQNNTALNFGSSATYRQANGLVTIGSGSSLTLSTAAGGDLRIAAGLTNNNAATGAGLITGGRALQTMGGGTYTKAGTDNLDYLIIGSATTLSLASGTSLSLLNTAAAGCLQFTAAGTLFMAGTNTVTIVAGGTVGGTSAGSIGGTTPTSSILSLAGACNWNTGGVITSSISVGIQVNAGLTITTAGRLSAGYVQINQNGFIGGTNPVVYPAASTLVYNHSAGTYGVQALEWPGTTGPVNVTVNANGTSTGISFGTNNISARTLTGTLTLNHDLDLSGSGPAAITTLNTIANATATVKGSGAYTQSASGSFTTANTTGINGTLTTSGTKTLPITTSFTFNNSTASQVTGNLLPATVANITINNPAATTGTTISNNTLIITGTTTLTAGALVLPTAAANLVTFTGNISTPLSGGTITGSTTSNITTSGTVAGTGAGIVFTTGAQNLGNWTCNAIFGGTTPNGLNSALSINGTFSFPSSAPDLYTTSVGSITFVSGSTFTQNGISAARILGVGTCTVQSGANMFIGSITGLASSTAAGAIMTTTRSFSGGANYTFNNSTTTQAIGDALDAAGGTGKTGPISGNVVFNNNTGAGVTLNAGTTVTVNSPGIVTIGTVSTAAVLTAPSNSIINGTGNVSMLGNGATAGSSLSTAHINGVNGTIQSSGTISLTNGANNNTNFTFNGSAAQTTGSLLPAIINNLSFLNTFTGALATPSVTLSASVTANGTTNFAGGTSPIGVVSIGAGNSLTLNGIITSVASKLIGTSTSNLTIGGSGTISAVGIFLTGGGLLNNFTMNRAATTFTAGTPLTVSGTFSTTAGIISVTSNTLTLNGPIAFGAGTITATGPLSIGGAGSITGVLLGTATPLSLTGITMNRSGAILPLGSNVTVSNTTGLILTAGNISLGNFNLTSTNATGQLGAGSSTSMIISGGTGQAFNTIPITTFIAQTFPLGDGTNYTPATLTFTANTVGGTVGAKSIAGAHPQLNLTGGPQANYLSRYWSFTTTGLTNYTYSSTFRYVAADINGTEALIKLNRYNGVSWSQDATSTALLNVLSSTSGLTQSTFPLNNSDYTGRVEPSGVNYTWNGVTNDWNTAGNWLPAGVPTSSDNVLIDGSLSAVLCSINSGSFSVLDFTLNGTGSFAMAAGSTLSINGAVNYGGSATAVFDCASTLNIASGASVSIPALNYGNLNLTGGPRVLANTATTGICGSFTPGAGVYTNTGSTIDFNGAGSQTIPVFSYNNLTSSSTGARTFASGVVAIASTFTPGTNAYTITGNTIDFNNAGSQTIPAFNYNNITNSGGGARILANSGIVGIAASFSPGAGAYTVTGSTVDYNGTSGFTLATFTYNNLTISNNKTAGTVSFGTGTITIGGALNYTATNATQAAGTGSVIFNSAGTQTIPALNYFNVNLTGGPRTLASAGTISIAGTTFTPGTGPFTIAGSTVNFNGTTGFAIPALAPAATNNYNNLSISGTGTYSFATSVIAGGNYAQSAGVLAISNGAVNNTLTVSGDFGLTGGNVNLINNGSATGAAVNIGGNFILNASGTAGINMEPVASTTGSSLVQVNGNASFAGSSTRWIDMGVTGTLTGNQFRIKGNLSASGTGNFYSTTSNAAGGDGIVFNGTATTAAPQTLSYTSSTPSPYISYVVNAGTVVQLLTNVAMGGNANPYANFTVNGILDAKGFAVSGGSATVNAANTGFTLASGATLITSSATGISGTVTNLMRNLNLAANYEFNGTAAQTAGSILPATVNNLTLTNNTGISLTNITGTTLTANGAVTFNGVSGLPSVLTTTAAKTLIIGSTGSVSGASAANGWVAGNLQKTAANGLNNFETGTTVYAPSAATMNGISGSVILTAKVTNGNPAAGSEINQLAKANHYWTISKTGAGTFTTYDALFNFTNTTNTGTTANYVVRKYTGSTWASTTSSVTGTTIIASGLTTFSDFEVGESLPAPVANTDPSNITVCTGSAATFSSTSTSTPAPSIQWQRDAGSGFQNIDGTTDAGIYSGFNTGTTLNISNATGLNTYQYRAVFSNINGSNNSAAATITVNPGGTWTGAVDNNWNTTGNWCGGLPASTTNVVLPSGANVVISSADAAVNSVTISAGATLTMQNNFNLNIAAGGSITNNGTFTTSSSTGMVSFLGNGTINGTTAFANLDVNGTVNMAGNVMVNGLLSIANTAILDLGNTGKLLTLNGDIIGAGTLSGSSAAAIKIGGTGAMTGALKFTTGSQSLSGFEIDRSGSGLAILGSNLSVTGSNSLVLTNGILVTNNNLLTADNNSISGGGVTSYIGTCDVMGAPVTTGGLKINNVGAINNLFPVGSTLTAYNPANLNNAGTADDFTVRVTVGDIPNTPNPSVRRVWNISEAITGGSKVTMSLSFTPGEEDPGMPTSPVYIVHVDGNSNLDKKGDDNTITFSGMQTVTSGATTFSTFSPFGITSGAIILPLSDLISFDARKQGNTAQLNWNVTAANQFAKYEIMKSIDGRTFKVIGTISNNSNQTGYSFNDANLVNGTNYYRLKITEKNGSVFYSKVAAIINKANGIELISLVPTIIADGITYLSIASAKAGKMELIITDITGKRIQQLSQSVLEGNTTVKLNLQLLAGGIYNITGISAEGKTKTLRFIRE